MSRERANGELAGKVPDIPSFPPCPAQVGWICPKCGRVLAPFMACCVHCAAEKPPAYDPARTGGLPPYTGQPTIFCDQ